MSRSRSSRICRTWVATAGADRLECDPDDLKRLARLRATLMRELFQTERSAEEHCTREAGRLAASPPAAALRACALHANHVNQALPDLARANELPVSHGGSVLGRALSFMRTAIVDRTIEEERSYRATLVGLRHGIDVVRMLQYVATASDQRGLAEFCVGWLNEREPLVAEVAKSMRWFAQHPAVAVDRPGWSGTLDHVGEH